MDGILRGQKIPPFEGKKEKFPQWSFTFLSICMIAGCKDALTEDTFDVPAEADILDPADVAMAIPIINRKANSTAYALLTICIKDATGFQAVRNGITTDLPNGSAREAWKNLVRIFQPKTTTQKYDLEQKFNDCKLEKETKHPDEWFTELEHIRVLLLEDHEVELEDAKMIQHIIYNIKPKVYETMVYTLKRELQYNTVNPLDLERIKDEIRQVYGQFAKVKTPETALAAGKSNKRKFKGDCRICGAKGHKSTDCWDNDKNKEKRPKWYKNPEQRKKEKTETANVAKPKDNTTSNTANAAASTNGTRSTYFCDYCKKNGHTEDRCFKKQRENATPSTT
jgi:hypothetical protein